MNYLFSKFFQLLLFNSLPHHHDFYKKHLKTLWEKEKMLVNSIFSSFHNVFYPYKINFNFLSHIRFVVCKFFQFWTSLKFCRLSLVSVLDNMIFSLSIEKLCQRQNWCYARVFFLLCRILLPDR